MGFSRVLLKLPDAMPTAASGQIHSVVKTRNQSLDNWVAVSPERAPNVLEVDQALRRLAEVDERKARVIEMRYFGGMDREEVATALGLTVHTVKKDLRLGEAWLRVFLSGDKC